MAYKKDQNDRDRFTKAKMLRNYAKLCEKEGISSDRVRIGPKNSERSERVKRNDTVGDDQENDEITSNNSSKPSKFNKHASQVKRSPFLKAEKQAEQLAIDRATQQQNTEEEKRNKELAIKNALKKRKQNTKIYTSRTKKGQPYLSKMSGLLLDKITSKI